MHDMREDGVPSLRDWICRDRAVVPRLTPWAADCRPSGTAPMGATGRRVRGEFSAGRIGSRTACFRNEVLL